MFHRMKGIHVDYRGRVEEFCTDDGFLIYDIDTTHVDLDHGVFDFGPMRIKVRKEDIDMNTWIWIKSKSKSPASSEKSSYMDGRVFQCDSDIARGIYLLNKYGIYTRASCSGHVLYAADGWGTDGFYVSLWMLTEKLNKDIEQYVESNLKHIWYDNEGPGCGCLRAHICGRESFDDVKNTQNEIIKEFYRFVTYYCGQLSEFERTSIPVFHSEEYNEPITEPISLSRYCTGCNAVDGPGILGVIYGTKKLLKMNYELICAEHIAKEYICGGDLISIDMVLDNVIDKSLPDGIKLTNVVDPFRFIQNGSNLYMKRPTYVFSVDRDIYKDENIKNTLKNIPGLSIYIGENNEIQISPVKARREMYTTCGENRYISVDKTSDKWSETCVAIIDAISKDIRYALTVIGQNTGSFTDGSAILNEIRERHLEVVKNGGESD